jgi:hypothetical protein
MVSPDVNSEGATFYTNQKAKGKKQKGGTLFFYKKCAAFRILLLPPVATVCRLIFAF